MYTLYNNPFEFMQFWYITIFYTTYNLQIFWSVQVRYSIL